MGAVVGAVVCAVVGAVASAVVGAALTYNNLHPCTFGIIRGRPWSADVAP